MTNFLLISLAFLISTNLASAASMKSTEFKCQEELTVQSTAREIPKGWHAWDVAEEGKNAVKKLMSISFYEGHPSKKAQLAPENADSGDNFWKWTFSPFGEKRKEPIWLACQYEDTQMILTRSLPNKFQKCRMDFKAGSDIKTLGPINCE
jgi:hypothetical protein